MPCGVPVVRRRTRTVRARSEETPAHKRLATPTHIRELTDGRERSLPREAGDEIVAEPRVKSIAYAEAVKVTERRVLSSAAIGISGFEGPLDGDVAVLGEGELCCAVVEREGIEV